MTDLYGISAKAWQINAVVKTLSAALPGDCPDDAIPIQSIVCLLIDASRDVAEKLDQICDSASPRANTDEYSSLEVL